MFKDLNRQQGITVILVTHDPKIAAFTDRAINMADGLICEGISDMLSKDDVSKFLPLLKTCIRALVRNPSARRPHHPGHHHRHCRSNRHGGNRPGSTLQIKNTIASMGADTLNIRPGAISKSGVDTGAGGAPATTNADCEAIAKDCPMVLRATPVVRASGQVIYGNKNWSPETVEGGSVEYLKIKSWYDIARGQRFSEEDVEQARRVCVIGQTVAKELFGDEDPLGKDIRIPRNLMFKVIGILQKKGANIIGTRPGRLHHPPMDKHPLPPPGPGRRFTTTSTGNSTTTFNRADKYTASSVDYYTETTTSPIRTLPIRGASTILIPSWLRFQTRNVPPRPLTRLRK